MFLPDHEGNPDDWDAFLEFCESWLCQDPNDNCYNGDYDHNKDDIVNFADFAYFASVWDIPSFTETHYYYLHDAMGSVRSLIGGKYNRQEDREFYNYDVYGKPSDTSAVGNPFMFAAYYHDTETGLYYLRARHYDPSTGRFIQFDPIGYADSMSLYEYVGSDPMNYIDPYGLFERNTDSWWKEGFSWSNPLGYFSAENVDRRQQLRQLQQYYEAKYQAIERERKLRGIDDNWKEECCCVAKDVCVGVVVGVGQGTANTVNGLQDSVIGVVNLPASVCNLLGADVYEIPSPDWSSGLLMTEDPLQHQISKFVGGESSYFLITVGAGNVAKALKNCKKPANALCDDLAGIGDDLLKPADEMVDLSKGAKPNKVTKEIGELRSAGQKDANHVIQDASARDLPGYNTNKAPGVQLEGPSTKAGTPHYNATQVQRQAGGGTYGAERRIGYKALRRAGYSEDEARQAIQEADNYFNSIGVNKSTPTRVPGNR